MKKKNVNRAYAIDPEDICMTNSIFDEQYSEELKEMDKHEIIVKICEMLGPNPSNLHVAENIFDDLKFEIARYVIHHEYCRMNNIRSKLLIWLDSKINPANAEKLSDFIDKYLK